MTTQSPIVLIDLSSIAYPAWHTHGGDPNPDACSQYVVGRVLTLCNGSEHVAVCVDSPTSFRKELDPSYKANRPEREAALTHQIAKAIEALRAEGLPIWKADGFEADDLIATATMRAMETSRDVLIVSGDKDLLQLVCPTVSVKSVRDGQIVDELAVFVKFGVYPAQIRDYLTLVGDSSDNIKGAENIGPKKARDLLAKHGTVDALYRDLEQRPATMGFTPGLAASLAAFRPRLATVRQLVNLRTDAPIAFDEVFAPRAVKPMAHEEPMSIDHQESEVASEPAKPTGPIPAPVTALTPRSADVLAPAPSEWDRQLEPRSMGDAQRLATDVFNSRLFAGAYGSAQSVLATILAGRELGLPAMASLRAIHIIEGKPTLSADLIRALVIRSGLAKYFRCTERTAERATFETQRGDDPAMSLTFTIEEARSAGLVKDKSGWAKSPADMCVARASAKLARLVYPDICFGLYTTDELTDSRVEVA